MSEQPFNLPPDSLGPPEEAGLDAANRSLAEALRKSFLVLKILMVVLVVMYFLSGWFAVKPNEVGFVVRFGQVADGGKARQPGWHWSWPYPFDQWRTVSMAERSLDVDFMFESSEEEKRTGKFEYRYNDRLSPARDDYLITGDVNIIHANLAIKYHISDPLDYLTYIHPAPDPKADARAESYRRQPEFHVMQRLTRDAVIDAAAGWNALDIRGSEQGEFKREVGRRILARLDALKKAGTPLGISIDPDTAVQASGKGIEAILPPRQVQEEFDKVFAIQTKKSGMIQDAEAKAEELLTQTAGSGYGEIIDAIHNEFDTLRVLYREKGGDANLTELIALDVGDERATSRNTDDPTRAALSLKRAKVEELLKYASGMVQRVIKDAEIYRDSLVHRAIADFEEVTALLPEYRRSPDILLSRLRAEVYASALSSKDVAKVYVPRRASQYWLKIPRAAAEADAEQADRDFGGNTVNVKALKDAGRAQMQPVRE